MITQLFLWPSLVKKCSTIIHLESVPILKVDLILSVVYFENGSLAN